MCLKENIARGEAAVLDVADTSVTRSGAYLEALFDAAGMQLVDVVGQAEWPPDLFAVNMCARVREGGGGANERATPLVGTHCGRRRRRSAGAGAGAGAVVAGENRRGHASSTLGAARGHAFDLISIVCVRAALASRAFPPALAQRQKYKYKYKYKIYL